MAWALRISDTITHFKWYYRLRWPYFDFWRKTRTFLFFSVSYLALKKIGNIERPKVYLHTTFSRKIFRISHILLCCTLRFPYKQYLPLMRCVFFSSSCVPYVASFYGLSIFDCPFFIIYRLLSKVTGTVPQHTQNETSFWNMIDVLQQDNFTE
jgi:hypothetical protein